MKKKPTFSNLFASLSLSKFKGKVHEPVMLLIKLRDDGDARCLQHAIGKSDLEAFVCEEATDASELMRRLRQDLGLKRINIFHSEPSSVDRFKSVIAWFSNRKESSIYCN